MKTKLLRLLRESDQYCSGQEMCNHLGVSRTAVWKVMNQLKEEGYQIDAVSNKGYRLIQSPNTVTEYEVASRLKTKEFGQSIYYTKEIDSTNSWAKILAADATTSHGTLVLAESQTAGRGRRGREWESPVGTGIWMSLILRPQIAPQHASMLTLVAAMALQKGIKQVTGIDAKIKWPNDIIINDKKVCGILTEMSSELDYIHYVVVGIGINVNVEEFPKEITEVATSLKIATGTMVCRSELIEAILVNFENYYDRFLFNESLDGLVKEYNEMLIHKDKEVRIIHGNQEREVIARGINQWGELIIEKDGEKKTILSGEISVRGINGYV